MVYHFIGNRDKNPPAPKVERTPEYYDRLRGELGRLATEYGQLDWQWEQYDRCGYDTYRTSMQMDQNRARQQEIEAELATDPRNTETKNQPPKAE